MNEAQRDELAQDAEPMEPLLLPEIPRGKFWRSVLVPPLLTPIFAPLAGGGVLPVILVAIIVCGVSFIECMSLRYRGRSLALLGAGYVVGELVACAAILLPLYLFAAGVL